MRSRSPNESSVRPEQESGQSKDGGVSTRLLEQVNTRKLDTLLEMFSVQSQTSETSSCTITKQQGGGMNSSIQSFVKWVGLSLPIIATIIAATVWVCSTIDNKVRESRLELKEDINAVKTELKSEAVRTQNDIKRLEDKLDNKLDKLSEQLTSLQYRDQTQKQSPL